MHTLKEHISNIGRLQKRPDFLHAQKTGKKWVSNSIVIYAAQNNLPYHRFGLTVTKKTFKQAVKRNYIRRRLRAAAYEILSQTPLDHKYDIILIGRVDAFRVPYAALLKDLRWCMKRLKITL